MVARSLRALGGVLVDGPRAAGKSETAGHHAASSVRLDISPELRVLAQIAPGELLKGETPRAVDEWQLAPDPWNAADGQH